MAESIDFPEEKVKDLRSDLRALEEDAKRRENYEFDNDKARKFIEQDLNAHTAATIRIGNCVDKLTTVLKASESEREDPIKGAIDAYYDIQDAAREDSTGGWIEGVLDGGEYYDRLTTISSAVGVDHRRL